MMEFNEIAPRFPGKESGLSDHGRCMEQAEIITTDLDEMKRCVHIESHKEHRLHEEGEATWKDVLGRDYDFVLNKLPEDPGPREIIHPFNRTSIERLGIKKGDILYGYPASTGCPVTHVGVVVEKPDYFNGLIVWCVLASIQARERVISIDTYTPVAYEGIVKNSRVELKVAQRYYFMPGYNMPHPRHSGLLNVISKGNNSVHVRLEGIRIG